MLTHALVLRELGVAPPRDDGQLVLIPDSLVIPAHLPAELLVGPACTHEIFFYVTTATTSCRANQQQGMFDISLVHPMLAVDESATKALQYPSSALLYRPNLPGIVCRHDLAPDVLVPEQLGLFRHHVLLSACVRYLDPSQEDKGVLATEKHPQEAGGALLSVTLIPQVLQSMRYSLCRNHKVVVCSPVCVCCCRESGCRPHLIDDELARRPLREDRGGLPEQHQVLRDVLLRRVEAGPCRPPVGATLPPFLISSGGPGSRRGGRLQSVCFPAEIINVPSLFVALPLAASQSADRGGG